MVATGTTTRRHVIEVVVVGDAGLNRFTAAAERAGAKLRDIERSANRGGSGLDRWGRHIQNVGYQVGDFAVQVASGTAASRAFAQQAPQVLGAFGVWGAVIGAAVATIAALAPALSTVIGQTADLGDVLGTFAPVVDAIGDAFVGVGKVAGAALGVIVDNLDRLLYYATAAATVIGIRLTTAFITSGRAATIFATAIGTARTALMSLIRVAPQLLAALALGELIYRFSVLVENVGGVGAALAALRDIAVEFGKGFVDVMSALPDELVSVWNRIKAGFMGMLAYLQDKWAEFIRKLADTAYDLGTIEVWGGGTIEIPGLQEAGDQLDTYATNAERAAAATHARIGEINADADASWQAAQAKIDAGTTRMGAALAKLRDLITQSDSSTKKLSDDLGKVGDNAADAGNNVTTAAEEIEVAVRKLSEQGQIIEGSFKSAFQSMIDGSKDAADAFGDMILSILQDITTFLVSSQLQQLLLALSNLRGFGWLGTTTMQPASAPTVSTAAIQGVAAPQVRALDPGLGSRAMTVYPSAAAMTTSSAASGGGGRAGLMVNIYNSTPADVQATETTDPLGNRTLEITVASQVDRAIRSGSLDAAFGTTYGLRRRAT